MVCGTVVGVATERKQEKGKTWTIEEHWRKQEVGCGGNEIYHIGKHFALISHRWIMQEKEIPGKCSFDRVSMHLACYLHPVMYIADGK